MRRFGVIVALGAMLGMFTGVVTASPALAARPKWGLLQAAPGTLPKSFCGFRVGVAYPVNKEYAKLLKSADGSFTVLDTGSLKVSLTNLSTGKAITVNASGPGKATIYADGSIADVATGHDLAAFAPADAKRFGIPTVSVITGRTTSSVAADGTFTSFIVKGHVLLDVCAALG
jgi:hypothetical protein